MPYLWGWPKPYIVYTRNAFGVVSANPTYLYTKRRHRPPRECHVRDASPVSRTTYLMLSHETLELVDPFCGKDIELANGTKDLPELLHR